MKTKIKARRMWLHTDGGVRKDRICESSNVIGISFSEGTPVAVIDVSDEEALISSFVDCYKEGCYNYACFSMTDRMRYALEKHGIIKPYKEKK